MAQMRTVSEADVEARVAALRLHAQSLWNTRIMESPFVRQLVAGELPIEAIRRFYHNLAQFVLVSNSLNLRVYYRLMPFLKRHWDLWEFFAGKIVDELSFPRPPGHTLVLLETGRALGLTDEQMLFEPVSAMARAKPDFMRMLVEHGAPADYWAAALNEGGFGLLSGVFARALVEHYGFTQDEIIYWTTHHEQDLSEHDGRLSHGAFNAAVLKRLLLAGYDDDPMSLGLEYCLTTNVEMMRLMLDDALEAEQLP